MTDTKMNRLLREAGFSPEKIREASDATLLRIPGFGRGMLNRAREMYGRPEQATPPPCDHDYRPAEKDGWFRCEKCGDVRLGPLAEKG